ncbi:uncharacterized protein LOC129597292 [Paramacrobiotus metropolitanus]|uniref:uncharacterized protein LOC129597292 n=1 Tax=Paramacrobiotus metropolitanus TaxID=2943436 RepID=UPI002445A62E|nr:uncharacterized protein LOC129597292 [Paramacrobiotus metropolitanus]
MNDSFYFTTLENSTSSNYFHPLDTVPYGVMSIPLELVGIIGSIVFLHELHQNTKNRTSASAMFVNLCLATLLQTAVTSPLQTYTFLTGVPNGLSRPERAGLCKGVAFIYLVSVKAVILCQASIALNRLFFVIFVTRFPILQSRPVIISLLAFPWLISVLSHCLPLFNVGGAYGYSVLTNKCSYIRNEGAVMHFQRSFVTVLALFIIVVSYTAVSVKIFHVQHRLLKIRPLHREEIATTNMASINSTGNGSLATVGNPKALRQMRREIRAAKIALLSSSVFVACYLPTTLLSFVSGNNRRELLSPLGMSLLMVQSIGISISPWLACLLHGEFDNKLSRDFLKWLETNAYINHSRNRRDHSHNVDGFEISSVNRSASHSANKRLIQLL